ncbi:unnamed protein product [Prunus armeniaca]|uniref:Uncharacterized protein n=1 Tax=Prunus armeniaca TaxID=36596 RepID=A0A6J5WH91_PRUAR|nr:unnamed protein product [Prunus armeniaca]
MALTYHGGALLEGDLPVSILWYGNFAPPQKSIVVDFLLSLNHIDPQKDQQSKSSVSLWWGTVQTYMKKAGKKPTRISLSTQLSDKNYSIGKNLKKSHASELAHRVNSSPGGLTLVLTSHDVAVEDFCMSNCGSHGHKGNSVFIWVGNSVTQCPGQCAWPFHQPVYGPQTSPLGAPNGDVGVDGMVVNIASLLAGSVMNPFGSGYYMGSAEAPLEAASACPGVYGKGAYPGCAGVLQLDTSSGASYNAIGVNGRTYLLPALFDPNTSQCSTIE